MARRLEYALRASRRRSSRSLGTAAVLDYYKSLLIRSSTSLGEAFKYRRVQ